MKAEKTALVDKIQKKFGIVGRKKEIAMMAAAIRANRSLLIEGPVGVGKTMLAKAVAEALGKKVYRVDGDSRFTEQKLSGWFDPSQVLKKGYSKSVFINGPLLEAMTSGSILFINELNRMPEAVQNVLLPALDEGHVNIPQLGTVRAKQGFLLIATQNPREFVATAHLSEALLDRMEWIELAYQSFEEERKIILNSFEDTDSKYVDWAVCLVRATRSHAKIRRGASIRAALSILQIFKEMHPQDDNAFFDSVKLALPNRIELLNVESELSYERQFEMVLVELIDELKKKMTAAKPLELSH